MEDFKFSTPVAFFVFNRPHTTARVFAEIAKIKPPKLLIIADGPRKNRTGEAQLVAETRAVIDRVDWQCEILTNFSDTNLGCRKRVSSGIDWVFDNVEEAIILEDDCLPDPSFFRFCQELLNVYRDNDKVSMISGNNFLNNTNCIDDSYYFSRYCHIWGWATWRRAWRRYDHNATIWPEICKQNGLNQIIRNTDEIRYWREVFEGVYSERIDTWDYQWALTSFYYDTVSIMPRTNLISNIGFGESATHTTATSKFADMKTSSMDFPLLHPKSVVINFLADELTARMHYRFPLWKSLASKLKRMVLSR